MIRRLIRWLARAEIAKAREEGFEAGQLVRQMLGEVETKLRCDVAFARGELSGEQRAFDAMEAEVLSRGGQRIEMEDVAKARKGRLN